MDGLLPAVKYAPDMLIALDAKKALAEAGADSLHARDTLKIGLSATVGTMVYDMIPGEIEKARADTGKAAALSFFLMNMADNIVDNSKSCVAEKARFLDECMSIMFGRGGYTGRSAAEEAAYAIARRLRMDFFSVYGPEPSERVYNDLVSSIIDQVFEHDPERLLNIEKDIGALSLETIYALASSAARAGSETARRACRNIGSYAQVLDNFSDIDKDLADGVNTYATKKLIRNGDSDWRRKEIGDIYFWKAQEYINAGAADLNADQMEIYKLLKGLMDMKYSAAWTCTPSLPEGISFAAASGR